MDAVTEGSGSITLNGTCTDLDVKSEGSEKVGDASEGAVAWVHGMAMRSEPTMFAGRDQVNPQAGKDCAADVYAQAGITNPREDFDCAEVYVPFSWYEPMWLENLGFCAEGDGCYPREANGPLAACGGGGGATPTSPSTPTTASASLPRSKSASFHIRCA